MVFISFIISAFHITFQCIQIVSCMEVVNPMIGGRFTIEPGAICLLVRTGIFQGFSRDFKIIFITGVLVGPCQHGCPDHALVVYDAGSIVMGCVIYAKA